MNFQELNHLMEKTVIRFTADKYFSFQHGMTILNHDVTLSEEVIYDTTDLIDGESILLLTDKFKTVSDLSIGIILSYAILRKDTELANFISSAFTNEAMPDVALKYCNEFYGPHAVANFELESLEVLKQVVTEAETDEDFTLENKENLLKDIEADILETKEKLGVPFPPVDLTLLEYRKEITSKIARKLLDKAK
jgi:hypothetical protein